MGERVVDRWVSVCVVGRPVKGRVGALVGFCIG